MIDYDASAIKQFLPICGVRLAPQGLEPASDAPHHYFYPPATVFPKNSLIRDTIDYCKQVQGNIKARRVGFLIQPAGPQQASAEQKQPRLIALVVNLTGPDEVAARNLYKSLNDHESQKSTEAILKDNTLAQCFRKLYAKAECVLVGVNVKNQTDQAIAQQIGQLIAFAYEIQGIALNFVPQAPQPSNVTLFNDLLTVFKKAAFSKEAIKKIDHSAPDLSGRERQSIVDPLKKKLEQINNADQAFYQDVVRLARQLDRHGKVVQWRAKNTPVDLNRYTQFKFKTYAEPFQMDAFLENASINYLLPLVIQQQAVGICQLLQLFGKQAYGPLEKWENDVKKELEAAQKKDQVSVTQQWLKWGGLMAYQSTLMPIVSEIVPLVAKEIDACLADELSWYEVAKGYSAQGFEKAMKGLAFGLTFSDDLAQRFARGVMALPSHDRIWRATGGLLGLYCTYLLGVYTLLRTAAFLATTQVLFQYGYRQHLDDATATVTPAKFKDIPLPALGRGIGLLLAVFEFAYTRSGCEFFVFLGGFLGSLSTIEFSQNPHQMRSGDEQAIAFMKSMGGQQLGRVLASLTLFFYFSSQAQAVRREYFLQALGAVGEAQNVDQIDVEFPSWVFGWWHAMTGQDPVHIRLSNNTHGWFYEGRCDLLAEPPSCEPPIDFTNNLTSATL